LRECAAFIIFSLIYPEDQGSTFLWNVDHHPICYTTQYHIPQQRSLFYFMVLL